MYDTSDIRKGLKIEIDGEPYTVIDFQFVKPGKGNSFTRCKIRNMLNGSMLDRTWKSGEKIHPASLDSRTMQCLYKEGDAYTFMDQASYEQYQLNESELGEDARFLLPDNEVTVLLHNDLPISVSLPNFVELEVTQTDPGVKGDTVTGGRKPATLATGATIQVPLFVEQGETLRIDTRTGDYVERVKK